MNNLLASLGFSHFLGIGPMRYTELVSCFGSSREAYKAAEKDLQETLGIKMAKEFISFRNTFNPEKRLIEINTKNIEVIARDDPFYPPQLASISDPPICIYVYGNKELLKTPLEHMMGVVGSRRTTSYGYQVTTEIVGDLARSGLTIISGMARGIDSFAHQSALLEHGKTIAVLGCGVDIVYPPSNTLLYKEIAKENLILSEFPPGHTVLPGLFIARNRIISALSKGILVVEGSQKSGSLITARYAGEQGRDLYAIPGLITSDLSFAPNMLITQGAKLVMQSSDILEDFGKAVFSKKQKLILPPLSKDEEVLVNILINEAKTGDELVEMTEKSIDFILNTLSTLEINGVIQKNEEGKYILRS